MVKGEGRGVPAELGVTMKEAVAEGAPEGDSPAGRFAFVAASFALIAAGSN